MTLISILLAVWLEKLVNANERFQFKFYFDKYWNAYIESQRQLLPKVLFIAVPIVVYFYIEQSLPEILQLPLQLLVLLLAMGCPHYREIYKEFLSSSDRGDQQACFMYSQKLGVNVEREGHSTVGQALVWHNYQYYLAVIFWFACTGSIGVLIYCALREGYKQEQGAEEEFWGQALTVMDWIPARLTALGYLLVGDYHSAIHKFKHVVFNVDYKARAILAEVAVAADEATLDSCSSDEAVSLVRLAKRATLLALAMIAIATLGGWVH